MWFDPTRLLQTFDLVFLGSPVGKESACKAGDQGSIPGSGRSPGEGIDYWLQYSWASLVAQMVKNLPAMQETWDRYLGREDPLEKGMVSLSSILAWRIPWTEEPGGLQSMGSQRVGQDWGTFAFILCFFIYWVRPKFHLRFSKMLQKKNFLNSLTYNIHV